MIPLELLFTFAGGEQAQEPLRNPPTEPPHNIEAVLDGVLYLQVV